MASAVWVGYPNALVEMRNVHGIEVQGGSFPAQIWHDYMSVGNSTCSNFSKPKHRLHFQDFLGSHTANGGNGYGGRGYNYAPYNGGGAGGNSAGGPGYRGYDPRFYASPPQGPPATAPPPTGGGAGGGTGAPPGGGAGGGTGAHP